VRLQGHTLADGTITRLSIEKEGAAHRSTHPDRSVDIVKTVGASSWGSEWGRGVLGCVCIPRGAAQQRWMR